MNGEGLPIFLELLEYIIIGSKEKTVENFNIIVSNVELFYRSPLQFKNCNFYFLNNNIKNFYILKNIEGNIKTLFLSLEEMAKNVINDYILKNNIRELKKAAFDFFKGINQNPIIGVYAPKNVYITANNINFEILSFHETYSQNFLFPDDLEKVEDFKPLIYLFGKNINIVNKKKFIIKNMKGN